MNYKKELALASFLAMTLAGGLGAISFSLPSATKVQTMLGIYTSKSGIGTNVSGGTFEPYDDVPLYAYLTQGGIQVRHNPVTFIIQRPDGTESETTAQTNDEGTAETVLSFLPSEAHVIGTWQIYAKSTLNGETAEATLTLQCKSENVQIDVSSKKNGAPSNSFLPSEQVLVEARLTYKSAPIAGTPITFEVKTPNDTDFSPASGTVPTDTFGTANTTFPIPWPSDVSLGTWTITASSEVFETTVNATTNFNCGLVLPTIDVYTQKGGKGPNNPGGVFTLNETVFLYAQIRDSLNNTVPNQLVGFEVKQYNGTIHYVREQTTDSTGTAYITHGISPDPANIGTYAIYVSADYNGIILLDTLTFEVQQP